jgi:hypothetical protein
VLRLREGARGGGERDHHLKVRGVPAEGAKLRAAGGGEEAAVVPRLREGARGGGGHPDVVIDMDFVIGSLVEPCGRPVSGKVSESRPT